MVKAAKFYVRDTGLLHALLNLRTSAEGRRYGFEFKFADAPSTTKSMRVALADLSLERLFVVYSGRRTFMLDDSIEAVPLGELSQRLATL